MQNKISRVAKREVLDMLRGRYRLRAGCLEPLSLVYGDSFTPFASQCRIGLRAGLRLQMWR
jgi:hypothetical protein